MNIEGSAVSFAVDLALVIGWVVAGYCAGYGKATDRWLKERTHLVVSHTDRCMALVNRVLELEQRMKAREEHE